MADYSEYTKEQLIDLLKRRDAQTPLGIVWERNEIDHDKALNDDFVALNLHPDLSIGDAPWTNLLIEGDNFDALRYLRMTFKGKVRVVYIDPPYNTGNKDFIYNDRYMDKEDSWKHSKWLEFMYRRLVLSRELLTEDGVIMVSINDENRAKLEMLLDKAMPGRRIGSFAWRTKDTGNDAGMNYSQVHEHVLVYANPLFAFNGKKLNLDKYRYKDENGHEYTLDPLTKAHTFKERQNTYYPIQNPETGYWYPCDPERVWAYASKSRLKPGQKLRADTIEDLIDKKRIHFPPCKPSEIMQWSSMAELLEAIKKGTGPVLPKKKTPLLREDLPDLEFWIGKPIAPGRPSIKSFLHNKKKMTAPVSSWIAGLNEDVDNIYDEFSEELETMRSARGGEGTDIINEILGTKAFNYPKPPSLIRSLIRQASKPDDIVLDFFAGSGTTAQAVLELNYEDKGNRRFILVSSTEATIDDPNKNICRDVCARRIKGVIEGYRLTKGTGGNFAYLTMARIQNERVGILINHEQVWLALQLANDCPLSPLDGEDKLQKTLLDDRAFLYLPMMSREAIEETEQIVKQFSAVVVYSWEPGILRRQLSHPGCVVEKIPDYLVHCFGGE